jgi:hypothetical protein
MTEGVGGDLPAISREEFHVSFGKRFVNIFCKHRFLGSVRPGKKEWPDWAI